MQDPVWLTLFLVVAALVAGGLVLLAALLLLWSHRRDTRSTKDAAPQKETYISFQTADFTDKAGFCVEGCPQSELLVPQAYWLVDGCIAEVEYTIAPAQSVGLRLARSGCLQMPDVWQGVAYQSDTSFAVDGVTVRLRQSPGQWSAAQWTRDGFDWILYARRPQMNLLGGLVAQFVQSPHIRTKAE